jgi:hypothetical protein
MPKKKWLTICEGGTVRSVALAFQLKDHGQDALAGSWRWTGPETFKMLFGWADYIILMQEEFLEHVIELPGFQIEKTHVVDVGPDTYGNPLHYDLNVYLKSVVEDWQRRNFNIK